MGERKLPALWRVSSHSGRWHSSTSTPIRAQAGHQHARPRVVALVGAEPEQPHHLTLCTRAVSYSSLAVTELGTISARPRGDDAEPAHTGAETLGITVIMPAYNEAPNLAEVVPRTAAVLGALGTTSRSSSSTTAAPTAPPRSMAELGKQLPQLRCCACAATRQVGGAAGGLRARRAATSSC